MELYYIVRPLMQPLIGAFHGWFATRMVVVMLFRPHKTYYFPNGKRIPFTPGIFPSRKADLARNISKTVTENLLTPEDIKIRAGAFITEENIFIAVDATVETMLAGLKTTDNLQRVANVISEGIPELVNNATTNFIESLSKDKNKQLTRIVEYFINEIFLNIKIKKETSEKIIKYIFSNFISSQNIRNSLQEALTPERATNLQNLMRERTTGALKLILTFVNLESIFNNLKDYLKNEPEKSEKLIEDIMIQLKIEEELSNRLTNLDFKKLSFEEISSIKNNLRNSLYDYLNNNKESIENSVSYIKESISKILHEQIINFNPSDINPERLFKIKKEITKFLYEYLKGDIGNIINEGIKALKPGELIESKITAYTSQDVEDLILGIMKKELKNLEFLGFVIGIVLGMSALAIEYFLPYK